jgi:hypothetical protein
MSTEQNGGRAAPRTLADDLRARDDKALAELLRARPDLLSPVPNDLTQLATRAGTRASVVRAVERLDRFALQTAEAIAVAPDPCPYATLVGLLTGDADAEEGADSDTGPGGTSTATDTGNTGGTDAGPAPGARPATREHIAAQLPRALRTLRVQALLWGDDDHLHLVRTVRELLAPSPSAPSPTGLGPTLGEAMAGISPGRLQEILGFAGLPGTHDPVSALDSLTALFADPERMSALLKDAPPASLAMLDKLRWGPPYGTVGPAGTDRTDGSAGSGSAGLSQPVTWLLDRGLLVRTGPRTVVLPREAALRLRAGRAHRDTRPLPPQVETRRAYDTETVDPTAAGQALSALATMEELLGGWEAEPPPALRAGGLGARELKRTAAALDVPEATAAFWVELAYAAGLLASDGEAAEAYAPTPGYDDWLRRPAPERWAHLVIHWLTGTRVAGLVGRRDAKGRSLSVLGPGLDRGLTAEVRRRVLDLLAGLEPGAAPVPESVLTRLRWERPLRGGARSGQPEPNAGADPEARAAERERAGQAGWAGACTGAPATPGDPRSQLAEWTLHEAELLGLTGRGALASHARALLATDADEGTDADERTDGDGHGRTDGDGHERTDGDGHGRTGGDGDGDTGRGGVEDARAGTAAGTTARATATGPQAVGDVAPHVPRTPAELEAAAGQAAARLAPLLPEPLDHVLLQADLTAIAPGPLERPLAAALGVLADVESKGGATVYRFTPDSVRRALDAGRSASDLHAFLAAHSRTPVPQPLSYLIDDVARRHGQLRVGAASSYVRCDDDSTLAEIIADRRSASLRPRLLAPTVLASPVPPGQLLTRLREMGYAPAAETAEGDVLIARADAHRTPPRTAPEPVPDGPPSPDTALLAAAVRAIRAGDHAATAEHKPPRAGRHERGGRAGRAGRASEQALPSGQPPRTTVADTLETMRSAVVTGRPLWIGYVNADGAASQRVIDPVRVEGGFVTAYDHTADEVRTYPLHRITGAAQLADGG